MLLFMLYIGTAISTIICQILAYKQHFYTMPIFVVNNNILAFFVHKIETFPIQLAIFDVF
jgi:ABC-type iron transport system FetAB permease component